MDASATAMGNRRHGRVRRADVVQVKRVLLPCLGRGVSGKAPGPAVN